MKVLTEGGDVAMNNDSGRHRRPRKRGLLGSNQYVRHEVVDPVEDKALKSRLDSMRSSDRIIPATSSTSPEYPMDDQDVIDSIEDDPDDLSAQAQLRERFPREYGSAVIASARRGDRPAPPTGSVRDLAKFISENRDGDDDQISERIATVTAIQTRFRSHPSMDTANSMSDELDRLNSDCLARIGL